VRRLSWAQEGAHTQPTTCLQSARDVLIRRIMTVRRTRWPTSWDAARDRRESASSAARRRAAAPSLTRAWRTHHLSWWSVEGAALSCAWSGDLAHSSGRQSAVCVPPPAPSSGADRRCGTRGGPPAGMLRAIGADRRRHGCAAPGSGARGGHQPRAVQPGQRHQRPRRHGAQGGRAARAATLAVVPASPRARQIGMCMTFHEHVSVSAMAVSGALQGGALSSAANSGKQ